MPYIFLEGLFLTIVVALYSDIVLVELVLSEKVVSDTFVETFDLSLLCLHVLILSLDDLEALHELELETSMLMYS